MNNGTTGTRSNLITVFLAGAPSWPDTLTPFDEDVSSDFRGSFNTIQTKHDSPIRVCETMPEIASVLHRTAFIRSMYNPVGDHEEATGWMMSEGDPSGKKNPFRKRYGAALATGGLPDPLIVRRPTRFRIYPQIRPQEGFRIDVEDDGSFKKPDNGGIAINTYWGRERMEERRDLVHSLEHAGVRIESPVAHALEQHREDGLDILLGGGKFSEMFEIDDKESDRYGNSAIGNGLILARRFAEAGAGNPFVYHFGRMSYQGWDMHLDVEHQLKEPEVAETDFAIARLIEDISSGTRGNTALLVTAEFGRTPRINKGGENVHGYWLPGGRDHFGSGVAILAGGNAKAGAVYGNIHTRGSSIGEVKDNMIPSKDFEPTILRLTGSIPPDTEGVVHELVA